jgi:hypothetical protein
MNEIENVACGTAEPIKPQNHQFVARVQKIA